MNHFDNSDFQILQENIVRRRNELVAFAQETSVINSIVPHTRREQFEKQTLIATRIRQLNEARRALNRLESRAHIMAETLNLV